MQNSSSTNTKSTQRLEDARAVAAILEQIPDLLKVKEVRKRDGSTVPFAVERIGMSFAGAFKYAGINDDFLLARCTHLALTRIDQQFTADETPSTEELSRVIVSVLIDNNLHYAVKGYFATLAKPESALPPRNDGKGLRFKPTFTRKGEHPYLKIAWEKRDAVITDAKGMTVFEQKDVEVPKSWSQTASNIVASKYFRGELGTPERETSARQLVDRVAKTISSWGRKDNYFASNDDATAFENELTHILINQMAAFNSPVWFNVGVAEKPQCSACFINSVRDDMRSIMNLAATEAMLFKGGSGTGTNLSSLRSSKENLRGSSGKSSGPVSFMKGFDAFAGVIKSGGKTRRAAKMVILNADHPDIEAFVTCKADEERKARAMIAAGYDPSISGNAYDSVFFQNANNSVRVTDDFMRAFETDGPWETRAVVTGEVIDRLHARDLLGKISQAAWECGNPGLQYDTTINKWHTCPNSGRINASNPCSEYLFLDDTACNLASLNLLQFIRKDGSFDVPGFKHCAEVIITAMEIIVGNASYPTPAIEENSATFRPLGIGYANLGALLMSRGLAYDSDEGRNFAAAISSLLSGQSYAQSAAIADSMGSFRGYKVNEKPFLKVIGMHRDAAIAVPAAGVSADLHAEARASWDRALEGGMAHGFRNSQISVLAPTGTISLMMDCDTTGIEPDLALVKYKWLVGGGLLKIVNQSVPAALTALGYSHEQVTEILTYIDANETIEGAPHLMAEHLSVFDCAFKPTKGQRSIQYMGHIRMMAAVQPFISGAISKTVNLPSSATVQEVQDAYLQGWKLGLKAIAIYRDGSKGQQVLTTDKAKTTNAAPATAVSVPAAAPAPAAKSFATEAAEMIIASTQPVPAPVAAPVAPSAAPVTQTIIETRIEYRPLRRRLPDERRSMTHKFSVGGHEGYVTVGLYDDGMPGEIFIRMAKGGTVVSGLMDAFATSTSIAMQYGVPLKVLVNKFVHVRFEPSGYTSHPNIRIAKSIVDYLFRWLALKFLPIEDQRAVGLNLEAPTLGETGESEVAASHGAPSEVDANQMRFDQAPQHPTLKFDGGIGTVGQVPAGDAGGAGLLDRSPLPRRSADSGEEQSRTEHQRQDPRTTGSSDPLTTSNALSMSFDVSSDAPACDMCGAIMVRNASCYKCLNCGASSGCS